MVHTNPSILIIYTGGTIGMVQNLKTGTLQPLNFEAISEQVPELQKFSFKIDTVSFDPPLDSSDMGPEIWIKISHIILDQYSKYDGFVILHGTDTMAFSASALSFILDNLDKPVIFTGSQLPIGVLRTDGKENLVTSVEIAAAKEFDRAVVPEVCIYFENKLFRGNRTTKTNTENFNAFQSPNYPPLADVGIQIKYHKELILYPREKNPLRIIDTFNNQVAILKIFPGMSKGYVDAVLKIDNLKGLVLETFGSGNAPADDWFIRRIRQTIEKGVIVLNVTQCFSGSVEMGRYETSRKMFESGVVSGYDITIEAAVTKMMFLLGMEYSAQEIKLLINSSIKGEITIG